MITKQQLEPVQAQGTIKCVVWDLDNTIWDGVLLEDESVVLRDNVLTVLQTLDERGILHSIASKNSYDTAVAKLKEFGIDHYFLYPQIHWDAKSRSLQTIAQALNIGLDTFAFVDDQPFEREEVAFALPQVMCLEGANLERLLDLPAMQPRFVTPESSLRRQMYVSESARKEAEEIFHGTNHEFLASLNMAIQIKLAAENDLQRAEELTVRTHQLNTTGYTYSYEELDAFRQSSAHLLFVVSLEDKFGPYGTIGLALLELMPGTWVIKLLLMSCRVMSRGIGTAFLSYLMSQAKQAQVKLQAEFVANDRNRMMYVTYKLNGFREIEAEENVTKLECDLATIQPLPDYLKIVALPDVERG